MPLISKPYFFSSSRRLAIGKTDTVRREVEGGVVVNYVEERMEAPHRGRLRRQFQKGLWFQVHQLCFVGLFLLTFPFRCAPANIRGSST